MSLINLILVFVFVGVLMWLINRYIPMAEGVKTTLNIAVIVILALWVIRLLGLWDLQIPRVG